MPAHHARGVLLAAIAVALLALSSPARAAGLPGFATSKACKECHPEVWRQWSMTPHARIISIED